MKRAAIVLLAIGLSSASALAEDNVPEANIAGQWQFVARVGSDCTFTGQATLTPKADGRNFSCELTARETCPAFDVHYLVRQSCTATRLGQQISVRSTIEEFLEGEPSETYFPDNFSLFIQDSTRMNGALISHGAHQAVWTRPDDGIS
ncbi:MAG: hypothetical protein V3V03_07635 [Hyphomonadaceae bacterium]